MPVAAAASDAGAPSSVSRRTHHRATPTHVARLRVRSRTCGTARSPRSLSEKTPQLEPQQPGPVVRPVEQSSHQRRADATAPPGRRHARCRAPRVARTQAAADRVQPRAADQFNAVNSKRHGFAADPRSRLESLRPTSPLGIRQLQRIAQHLGLTHQARRCLQRRQATRDGIRHPQRAHSRCSAHDFTLASAAGSPAGSVPPAIAMSARPPPLPPTCCAT